MAARVSQEVAEIAILPADATVRASQEVVEAATLPNDALIRASQDVAEVNAVATPVVRASQNTVESLIVAGPQVRVSQFFLEVLVPNIEVFMPAVYPTLIGLGYAVNWKPNFFVQSQQAASGANIDLALSQAPIHEFTLTYDFLRDSFGKTEFKTMMGFFLRVQGNSGRFLFQNPDDNSVSRQIVATTDGAAHLFPFIPRTFGDDANSGSEPVGYVDLTQTFNLYLDNVWQSPSTYSVLKTIGGNQQIQFNYTPTVGQVITIDMSYFYYCKFADPSMDFEKFMDKLWTLKTVTLRSCRAGT